MKWIHLGLLAGIAIAGAGAQCQQTALAPSAPSSALADPQATLAYIHAAWDTLTRSTTDCHLLVDVKVTANPVLYLPAELAALPEVAAVAEKCKVKVATLPGPRIQTWSLQTLSASLTAIS